MDFQNSNPFLLDDLASYDRRDNEPRVFIPLNEYQPRRTRENQRIRRNARRQRQRRSKPEIEQCLWPPNQENKGSRIDRHLKASKMKAR